ncbi:aromatic ring-hydroxylating oxygenase subunit alpha [Rhodopirellula halodulae]|uniref:aromatic ring-hydroxylating oxygenase subunit alpha n=1 Tax=Rhodopirellula halodulae TaxID=2894198 RepID=UPI001E651B7E|nr:aromatic ring-hydroxylating dioxygenase subunit alpha [Rhodopirellula sp. JC737]MCC9654259.1 aromatic ring-hydroxylating dioxygenase subunit alpha [Rhodopirellula sp. JC737]
MPGDFRRAPPLTILGLAIASIHPQPASLMFVNKTKLPHVLLPEHYSSPTQHELELEGLFRPQWHWVGSLHDAREDGDFFTRELLGVPILVRNHQGAYHCYLNVCPHRHSTLSSERSGNCPTLKCQYHGWEFDVDGSSGRIPDAKHFRPMSGGPECLKKFSVAVHGPLIFVSLEPSCPSLPDQFQPFDEVSSEFPGDRWAHAETWHYDFPANWKVVAENTVESYHLESVHTDSFRFEPEDEIEHEIHEGGTIMRATIHATPRARQFARWVTSQLHPGCSPQYRMHHLFPHLFLMRTDAMLQAMTLMPTSATSCRATVSVFTLRREYETPWSRLLTRFWGRIKTSAVKKILAEDASLYPGIQTGMEHSPFKGCVSTREELVHAFQHHVSQKCGLSIEPDRAAATSVEELSQ